MKELVQLDGIAYRYEGASEVAVRAPSFQVGAGDTVCLSGPTAAGKSTVLGILAGELPTAWGGSITGTIHWDRIKAENAGTQCRIGAVLGSANEMFSAFLDSLEEELLFDLRARGYSAPSATRRIAEVAETLRLTTLLGRNPFTLSGGEKQRAALALAVIAAPQLLVLDDPAAHLDSRGMTEWLDAIRLLSAHETAIVFEGRGREAHEKHAASIIQVGDHVEPVIRANPPALPPLSKVVECFTLRCERAGYAGRLINSLSGFELGARAGDCVGLIGPNGVGKSTLLKSIAGIIPVFEGTLAVDGTSIAGLPPHARCHFLSLALQDPRDQLFASSVQEEIALGARLVRRLKGSLLHDAVNECAAVFGIQHLVMRHPRELSRGELRRVGVASTIALNSPILLLDEPTVGLDATGLYLLTALITEHRVRGGITILATHDMEWATSICSSLVDLGNQE